MSSVSEADLNRELPQVSCEVLSMPADQSIAERYRHYALVCFERLQALLDKPRGQVLLQLVLSNQPEHEVFAGLSGLLKTAMKEKDTQTNFFESSKSL